MYPGDLSLDVLSFINSFLIIISCLKPIWKRNCCWLKNMSHFSEENSGLLMTVVLEIFQECCNALDYPTLLESCTEKGQEDQ